MNKLIVSVCLLGAVLMCSACATSMSYKNIKEVDNYLEQERANAKAQAEVGHVQISQAKLVKNAKTGSFGDAVIGLSVFGGVVSQGVGIVAKEVMGHKSVDPKSPVYEVSGIVAFNRKVEVYRSEPGKDDKNIIAEGFKNTPLMTSCELSGFAHRPPRLGHVVTYDGEDGKVAIADFITIRVYISCRTDSEPQKNEALSYFTQALENIAGKLNEQLPAGAKAPIGNPGAK